MKLAIDNPNSAAEYFLSKRPMSQKKLHKMLYFSYAWYLYINNDEGNEIENRLFENTFQAWVHGPVLTSIYFRYNDYGFREISSTRSDFSDLKKEVVEFLNSMIIAYGNSPADELEMISHMDNAWKNARIGYGPFDACKVGLSDLEIFEYRRQTYVKEY